jgi:acetolactate synthase small subunit
MKVQNSNKNIYNSSIIDEETSINEKKLRQIQIIVDNEFGALAKVISLFSSRGYNIDELYVFESDKVKKISTILIKTNCTKKLLDLIIALTEKLVFVYSCKEVLEFEITAIHNKS